MTTARSVAPRVIPVAVLGLLGLYVLSALGFVPLPPQLALAFALALGLMGVLGVLAVAQQLDPQGDELLVRAAAAYGVAAFAIWETVVVIQRGARSIVELFGQRLGEGAVTPEMMDWAIRSAMAVQATMDVAFDVFYCMAIVLLAARMLGHPDYGRWLGGLGVGSGLLLLALNLWTFPVPPAEAGLIDVGPLTGIWWVLVVVRMVRTAHSPGPPRPATVSGVER